MMLPEVAILRCDGGSDEPGRNQRKGNAKGQRRASSCVGVRTGSPLVGKGIIETGREWEENPKSQTKEHKEKEASPQAGDIRQPRMFSPSVHASRDNGNLLKYDLSKRRTP
ncbi:hypothetical protein MPNT_40116 [Candidatus Methylacidithermus pantelleriae]|uniref:Uncharacterized protein n=1 Tax=Candidatus Methylacidithermus pantelleriae TaxID=2744239 RepID=A0A8J2BRC5_9BACT|nr:hypothetical protein MPNT_40116 [Candidatus Methylacidithermus pantelleriae]